MTIVRCISCDGYGWFKGDDDEPEQDQPAVDCDWCGGIGYVYRDADGLDHRIPPGDFGLISDELERLEKQRMHELGYSGDAVHPRDQKIRQRKDASSGPPSGPTVG
jgi:hypothetical protein